MKKYFFILFIALLVSSDSLSMGLWKNCAKFLMPNSKQKVIKESLSESELLKQSKALLNLVRAGGRTRLIKKLLVAGANVNYQDDYGWTALMVASENGHIDIVRLLLEKGANVNYQSAIDNFTALMLASKKNHIDIVRLLLAYGANVNHQDEVGWTALIWASGNNHIDIVKLLLAAGANVDL